MTRAYSRKLHPPQRIPTLQEMVMIVRFGSTVVLALTVAAGTAQAQGFQYTADSGAFDVVSATKTAQEAMGQKQEVEISSSQRLTVGVTRRSGDSLGLSVRIDSIAVRHSAIGDVDVSTMQGLTINADLARDGLVRAVHAPEGVDANLADQIARLMPRVRASLKVGAVWADTLAGEVLQGGLTLQRKVVTTSRVVGDTVANGQKAWRIAREAQTSVAGSGEVQGQPMTVEGNGTGTGTWVVTGAGAFLGASLSDTMATKVTMAANGIEVTGSTTATTTVSRRD
jgi:hypothetical protein